MERPDLASPEEVARFFSPEVAPWHDTAGYVQAYRALVDAPSSPVRYDRKVHLFNLRSPFPIKTWWDLHQPGCGDCTRHLAAHGNFLSAIRHNEDNPCVFADIYCWLSGGWRLPLSKIPDAGHRSNHSSLDWSPSAMIPEVDRMLDIDEPDDLRLAEMMLGQQEGTGGLTPSVRQEPPKTARADGPQIYYPL
jgi:hypothetical protein